MTTGYRLGPPETLNRNLEAAARATPQSGSTSTSQASPAIRRARTTVLVALEGRNRAELGLAVDRERPLAPCDSRARSPRPRRPGAGRSGSGGRRPPRSPARAGRPRPDRGAARRARPRASGARSSLSALADDLVGRDRHELDPLAVELRCLGHRHDVPFARPMQAVNTGRIPGARQDRIRRGTGPTAPQGAAGYCRHRARACLAGEPGMQRFSPEDAQP